LEQSLNAPSLYDEAVKLLARNGLHIDAERLNGDWTKSTAANASVQAAWTEVYRDTTRYWALYELAEKLVDLETAFRFWRFRHVPQGGTLLGFQARHRRPGGRHLLAQGAGRGTFPGPLRPQAPPGPPRPPRLAFPAAARAAFPAIAASLLAAALLAAPAQAK